MKYFNFRRIVCTLAWLAASGQAAYAVEWFVSPLGSDTAGNGSLAAPYKTLGYLLNPGQRFDDPASGGDDCGGAS